MTLRQTRRQHVYAKLTSADGASFCRRDWSNTQPLLSSSWRCCGQTQLFLPAVHFEKALLWISCWQLLAVFQSPANCGLALAKRRSCHHVPPNYFKQMVNGPHSASSSSDRISEEELGPSISANESGFIKEEAKLSVCWSKNKHSVELKQYYHLLVCSTKTHSRIFKVWA